MIPTEYIKTNAIPLNSNGKKDIHKILIVAEKIESLFLKRIIIVNSLLNFRSNYSQFGEKF